MESYWSKPTLSKYCCPVEPQRGLNHRSPIPAARYAVRASRSSMELTHSGSNTSMGFDRRITLSTASIFSKAHLLKEIEFTVCDHDNHYRLRLNKNLDDHSLEMVFRDGWKPISPKLCLVRGDIKARGQAVLDTHAKTHGTGSNLSRETLLNLIRALGKP